MQVRSGGKVVEKDGGLGIWVVISEGDKELKVMNNYIGPLPQVGQRLTFLSGEGVFLVKGLSWMTSKEKFYTFFCYIQVERL